MAKSEEELIAEYERLRRLAHELDVQSETVEQRLIEIERQLPDRYTPPATRHWNSLLTGLSRLGPLPRLDDGPAADDLGGPALALAGAGPFLLTLHKHISHAGVTPYG